MFEDAKMCTDIWNVPQISLVSLSSVLWTDIKSKDE